MSASTEIPSSCWSVFTSFRRRRCRIDLFSCKNQNLKHGGNGGKKSEGTEEFRGCKDDPTIAACPKIAVKSEIVLLMHSSVSSDCCPPFPPCFRFSGFDFSVPPPDRETHFQSTAADPDR